MHIALYANTGSYGTRITGPGEQPIVDVGKLVLAFSHLCVAGNSGRNYVQESFASTYNQYSSARNRSLK